MLHTLVAGYFAASSVSAMWLQAQALAFLWLHHC